MDYETNRDGLESVIEQLQMNIEAAKARLGELDDKIDNLKRKVKREERRR